MTTAEMLAVLDPMYREALGKDLRDVPEGMTATEWHLTWQATTAAVDVSDFMERYARPAAAALAHEAKEQGCDAFGHLRIVDRVATSLPVGPLITRRRPREFVVYAVGWKEKA